MKTETTTKIETPAKQLWTTEIFQLAICDFNLQIQTANPNPSVYYN